MQGVNIIAPTERDFFSKSGTEMGPYEAQNTDKNTGDYLEGTPEEKHGIPTDVEGKWNTFQNGQKTEQQDGSSKPGGGSGGFWKSVLDYLNSSVH